MSTASPDTAALGFVGLGQMGSLMADRLIDWPGGLTVYDVLPDSALPLQQRGAKVAGSVQDLARSTDIIGVMVRDDEQVRDVFDAVVQSARSGTIVTVHSTIRPSTAVELEGLGRTHGIRVLDVPVSGGVIGARAGRLALLAGGDPQAFEQCREPFELMAEIILHFGSAGSGTRAKLARNLVNFVGIAAALEAARLADLAGVDVGKLSKVTTHTDSLSGGPGAVMLRGDRTPLEPDDPLRPIFAHTCELGEKDLSLALELGDELGLELPLANEAYRRLADYLGVPHQSLGTEQGGA